MIETWKAGTPAHRRYVVRTFAFMAPYVVICIVAMGGVFDEVIGTPAGWVLAGVVSAPVIGQIWATLALMRESDEYVRAMIARQFIIATGIALAGATLWGFAETFAGAPHLPAWLVYPLFWAAFGCVAPFVRSTNG